MSFCAGHKAKYGFVETFLDILDSFLLVLKVRK